MAKNFGWNEALAAANGNEGIAYVVYNVIAAGMSLKAALENENMYGDAECKRAAREALRNARSN